jgi:uncharacterized paraquat-inducible protein A
MPKKEFVCYSCDMHFTVVYAGSDQVQHCPFCGAELEIAEANEYEDEE